MNATLKVTMRAGEMMDMDEPLAPETWETDAETFIADNGFEDGDADEIREMFVGDAIYFGGGAAPEFEIERLS